MNGMSGWVAGWRVCVDDVLACLRGWHASVAGVLTWVM